MKRALLSIVTLGLLLANSSAFADGGQLTPGGLTKVTHGSEMTGNGTTTSSLVFTPCGSAGQVWMWNGSAWACTTPGGLSGLTTGDLIVATSATTGGNFAGSDPGACTAGQADTHPALSAAGVLSKSCSAFVNAAGTGLTLTGSTLSMPNVGPGASSYTYGSFTLDAQGRITAASSGTAPVTSVGVSAPITTTGGLTPTIGLAESSNFRTSGGNLDLATAVSMPGSLVVQDFRGTPISPTAITGTNNDWAPTGLSTATTIRVNTSGTATITGITGGVADRELTLEFIGANPVTLANQITSTAANQIITGAGADLKFTTDMTATLRYDGTTQRWRLVSYTVPNGTGLVWSAGTLAVDSTVVQSRVSGTCADPFGIISVASNGTVTCSTTTLGGTLTNTDIVVATGAHTTGNFAGSTPAACGAGTAQTATAISASGTISYTCTTLATLGAAAGTGTANKVTKWNNTSGALVDSSISDNGTTVSTAEAVSLTTTLGVTGLSTLTGGFTAGAASTVAPGVSSAAAAIAGTALTIDNAAAGNSYITIKAADGKNSGVVFNNVTGGAADGYVLYENAAAAGSRQMDFAVAGTQRLNITNTGAVITGTESVSGLSTLTGGFTAGAASTVNATLNTAAAAGASVSSVNAGVVHIGDTTSSAAGVGGQITFAGNYTGVSPTNGAVIKMVKTNGTAGNASFGLVLATRNDAGGGDVTPALTLNFDQSALFGGQVDMASHKIVNCANGTVSSDGACFGQIASGVNAAVSGTSGRSTRFTGTNTVGNGALTDDGTNITASAGTVTLSGATTINNTLTVNAGNSTQTVLAEGGGASNNASFTLARNTTAEMYVAAVGAAGNFLTDNAAGDMTMVNGVAGKAIRFGIGSPSASTMVIQTAGVTGTLGNGNKGAQLVVPEGISGENGYGGHHLEWNDDWMGPFNSFTGGASAGTNIVTYGIYQFLGSSALMTATPLGGVNTRPGMIALAKSTSASQSDYVGFVSSPQAVNFGDGDWSYQWVGGVSATSSTGPTVASAYNMLIGFFDTPSAVDQTDGCYFLYDVPNRATGGQNAGNAQDLEAVCVSNSVRTVYLLNGVGTCDASFTKGTAAVGAWANSNTNIMNLQVKMLTTTEADFFYNGTQVCKITTNIPTNSSLRMTGFGFALLNDATSGTGDKQMYTDFTSAKLNMTSARSP